MAEAVEEYTTSLEDLTFNSKPHINALTMLAEEYVPHADLIVRVIEAKLHKASSSGKLPVMYLMDSIVKNVGGNYTPLFAQNIVKCFLSTFERGDEKVKMSLYKLRTTWDNYFPLKRLYELDMAVRKIDPNWPVKPLPTNLQDKSSKSIHTDLQTSTISSITSVSSSKAASSASGDSIDLKQDLINKQKQLLELQQQKLLLELEQTKQQLAMREKRNQVKQVGQVLKDPRLKVTPELPAHPTLRVTLPNGQKPVPKDPRMAAASKVKPIAAVNKGSDPRVKLEAPKKNIPETDKSKPLVKKSPADSEKQLKKKKASPANSAKASRTPSPKTPPKSDPTKKSKIIKKKIDTKIGKKTSDGKAVHETSKSEKNEQQERVPPKTALKKRDRLERRSPPRVRPPPAKQPRRSTSVERRKSPSPAKRTSEPLRHLPRSTREDVYRDTSRSNEGSSSPRFSPEPDEEPGRRQNWRPPLKRMRKQEPPASWRPDSLPREGVPPSRRRSSIDPNLTIPQELTLAHQAEILKQAEIQLQTGQLTHSQHQDFLKQLHQLFELQRLRNYMQEDGYPHPPEDPGRMRMPLDELMPERHGLERPHGREDFMREPMHRNDENQPPPFRPPPSPPRMDIVRDDNFHDRHDPRALNLTPPPMPPSIDPRPGRNHLLHLDEPRFHRGREKFPPPPRDPGFRPEHGRPHRTEFERGPQRMEKRPSPERRRGSGNWGNLPPSRTGDYGEDLGNVFVLEEEETTQQPTHRESGPGNVSSELHNGSKPTPARVPLRSYAHPELENDSRRPELKRRGSFEGKRRPRRSPPRKKEHRRKSPTRKRESPPNETEDKEFHLEEPEDYIIASIPPGAEAYHEHSMKINAHKKNIVSQYAKKLAESGKEEDADPNEKSGPFENLAGEPMSSPDASRRDKFDEDINKSPSLPLKKRKYLISSSNKMGDSSDAATEAESDVPDLPVETLASDITEGDTRKDQSAVPEVKENKPSDSSPEVEVNEQSDLCPEVEGNKQTELSPEVEGNKPSELCPEIEGSEQSELCLEEQGNKPSELCLEEEGNKASESEMVEDNIPPPAEIMDQKASEDEELPVKIVDENQPKEDSIKDDPVQNDSPKENAPDEKKEEVQKIKEKNPVVGKEKSLLDKKDSAENLLDNKKGLKKAKKRRRDKNGRMHRIQQLAEETEMKALDQGPRGKQFHMSRSDVAKMNEEERLRGLMMEEEERIRWEAELEMQLERDEFLEKQRLSRSPPRGGWGRGDGGPWRGRGDRGRGWARDREFWDGPPFRGRSRGRMPPRRHEAEWVRLWDDPPPGPRHEPGRPDERLPRMKSEFGRGPDIPPQPLPSKQPQPEMSQVNVNKLLSDLLNMGIIPGPSKIEPDATVSTSQTSQESHSTITTSQTEVKPALTQSQEELSGIPKASLTLDTNRVPTPVFEDILTLDPDEKLPNVTLNDVEKLKVRHEELIKRLYTGIQCSACGMRFTACQTDMYAEHLDWHYRMNRKDKDGIRETHRMLYPTAGEWITYEEIADPSQRTKSQVFEEAVEDEPEPVAETEDPEELVVPVAKNPEQDKCAVCNEAFKTVYNDEAEEWQYVNCVAVEDQNFHPTCYADHNDSKEATSLLTPVRVPLYNPLEESMKGIPGLDSLMEDNEEDGKNDAQPESDVNAAVNNQDVAMDGSELASVTEKEAVEENLNAENGQEPIEGNEEAQEEMTQNEPPATDVTTQSEPLPVKDEPLSSPLPATVACSDIVKSETKPECNEDEYPESMQGETQPPSTSEPPDPVPEETQHEESIETPVKVEQDQEDTTFPESSVQVDSTSEPFVNPVDTQNDPPQLSDFGENIFSKNEPVSPETTGFPPENSDILPPSLESLTKLEYEPDESSAFPIPTLGSVTKIEQDDALLPKVEPNEGDNDQPLPPGTEPSEDVELLDGMNDDSDLDYDDSDINVTI